MSTATEQKMGRWARGWELAKSSWHVLKLDKELSTLPLIGFGISLLVLIPYGLMAILSTTVMHNADGTVSGASFDMGHWGLLITFSLYAIMALIGNFFTAALIRGAIDRFEGKDPTVKSSVAAAWQHRGSIAAFSLFASTIGYLLQIAEQKVPFAGRIALWIAGTAWAIATFFALPVIVTSDKAVGPIEAVRESAGTVKRVWGESIVAQLGIGLVGGLVLLAYTASLAVVGGVLGLALHAGFGALLGIGMLWIIGFVTLAFIFSILAAIAKAAVFYYAKTGESPVTFNKELLRAAMTPKKARKLFV